MPERDRPSLTGLAIKRPFVERGKPLIPLGEAESALLGNTVAQAAAPALIPSPVLEEVQSKVHTPVLSPTLLKARQKELRIAWTFKIPHELHQELARVAAYNELTMSDIVIEAIRFHLPNFPHPPHHAKR